MILRIPAALCAFHVSQMISLLLQGMKPGGDCGSGCPLRQGRDACGTAVDSWKFLHLSQEAFST